MRLAAIFSLVLASAAVGQVSQPPGVWLEWQNLHIAIAPDSSGALVWARSVVPGEKARSFGGTFEPARVNDWVIVNRELLTRPLAPTDTAVSIGSTLRSISGKDSAYLVRRPASGTATEMPMLVLVSPEDSVPLKIIGSTEILLEIIDSLAAASSRAPYTEAVAQRVVAERIDDHVDKPASGNRNNRPPEYPRGLRERNIEGQVTMSFIIGVDGRIEMSSVRALRATHPDFLKAVMDALPRFQFTPAERQGVRVRSRVAMPFAFSLKRCCLRGGP